jgi:O-antigen ligase
MNSNLARLARLPMTALLIYFASGIELWIFEAYGVPPLYLQLVGLACLLGWIAFAAMSTGGRFLNITPRLAVAYAILLVYMFLTAVSYLYSSQNDAVTQALIDRLKGALFLILFSFLLRDRELRSQFSLACTPLAILSSVLCIFDFITPTFSTVPGRGAGFYLNPNETAVMLIALGVIASERLRVIPVYLLWSLVGIATLLTFSRTGWMLLVVALTGLIILGRLGGGKGRFLFLLGVSALLAVLYVTYLSGDLYIWITRSSLGQYLDPNTLARLGARGVAQVEYSSIEREAVFQFAIQKFFESPFVGWGVGYVYAWSESVGPHNMALALAVDLGVLGPLLYFALFGLLIAFNGGLARLLALLLLAGAMFAHNQLEALADLAVLAYAIAGLGVARFSTQAPELTASSAVPVASLPRRLAT